MRDIRLIAADMDHTLLLENSQLPPGIEDTILRLKAAGIVFTIASGRPYYTLKERFPALWQDIAFSSDNGAALWYQGRLLSVSLMKVADYQAMAASCADLPGVYPIICGLDRAYIPESARQHDGFYREFYTNVDYVPDEAFPGLTVEANKFTLHFANLDSQRWHDELYQPRFGKDYSLTVSGPEWIDFMNNGVDKGSGLRALGAEFGITTDQMMAFGDNFNDVAMLKTAYHSYAVANAAPGVEQYARFRCPSNEELGVQQTIDALLAEMDK